MKKIPAAAWLISLLVVAPMSPALGVEAQTSPPAAPASLEQRSFDDLASRLAEHLRATADLLTKIRQTTDPAERESLEKRYAQAMQTTDRFNRAMQSLLGSASAGREMGCAMMGAKSAPGQEPAGSASPPDSGDHESHH